MPVNEPGHQRDETVAMQIFDLSPSLTLGRAVAHHAGCPLSPMELRPFRGGQHKARPLVSVRGHDVFVLSALHGSEAAQRGKDSEDPSANVLSCNDLMIRLLFFIATCRDHGARRVTAVVPWLPYARKDRVTKARDPVSARYVAQLFEAVGTDALLTVDVHNLAAFQNGFRCQTIHLDTVRLFATEIAARVTDRPLVVMSPDSGGVKRAEALRQAVETLCNRPVGFAFMDKHRSSGRISGLLFAGEVSGCDVWIVDDMIDSGETMLQAAQACRDRGAMSVHLVATHALGGAKALARLSAPTIDTVTITDSATDLDGLAAEVRLTKLSVAAMLGQSLRRMHEGAAVSPVLDPTGLPP